MGTDSAIAVKVCVKCGKNVAGKERMKDSKGQYWCMECGAADQKLKGTALGGICAGCGEQFSASELSKWGKQRLCNGCARARKRGPGLLERLQSIGGGGTTDKGRLVKMLAVVALLAAVAAWQFLSH